METAVITCLYGLYDQEVRSLEEMRGYEGVVAVSAQFRPSDFYLCGGYTNSDHPDRSEASSVFEAFGTRFFDVLLPSQGRLSLVLEEASKNTPQNIYNALRHFLRGRRSGRTVVFVDTYRAPKTWVLMFYFWLYFLCCHGRLFTFRVIGIPREDTHPNSSWKIQISEGLAYFFCPWLIYWQVRKK